MFVRPCENTDSHLDHTYEKMWKKADLPHLRHPELYPEYWRAEYECPGVNIIAWNVAYLHEDCPACDTCADNAIDRALEKNSSGESWQQIGPHEEIQHRAVVERI